ncbi:Gfo/Idh/MocA family oxidoreductase [Arthrobacter sp. fls2-241-R2A-200]|uniref:Gfo/Idh/MocA family protein n=1 Tax=Arthrobacter sp. fls2-241-R2A-200 TaxID=3040281 RepID=UPI00254D6825|nr:Gfo/Idh/MocA family oxidoreductase [Arthrobacter sp. fls2-241-R2A-200]
MPDTKPIRIGVLGAARIANEALLAPARLVNGVHVTATAARNIDRARAYADKHDIPRVHSSYESMLADPDIDAVYVPLPAALHAEWTIASLQAGKHVLVEKPFTSNTAAAESVASFAANSDRVVMEAYHTHYHPLHGRLREILASGEIGKVHSARATFCIPIPPGRDIRWNLRLGGGSLLDIGYYPVRTLTGLFGQTPQVGDSQAWMRNGVDRRVEATMHFDNGVSAQVVSSLWSRQLFSMALVVHGETGQMQVTRPYHPHMGSQVEVKGIAGRRTERTSRKSTYTYQLEAFRDSIRGKSEAETDCAAAVRQIHTLDAIYSAAGLQPRP